MNSPDKKEEPLLNQVGGILSLGFNLAICIAGGCIGGIFFDRWAGTAPIATLVGLLVGIAAGIYQSYRLIMKFLK